MASQLHVNLPPTWTDHSHEDTDGPRTYIRHASADLGALQVTWVTYGRPGEPPKINDDELIATAKRVAASFGGELTSTSIGQSSIGRYGKVTFESEKVQKGKVWVHTQGPHQVMVTHLVTGVPDQSEVDEAEQIVMSLAITADNLPMQRNGAAGIIRFVRKLLGRGSSR